VNASEKAHDRWLDVGGDMPRHELAMRLDYSVRRTSTK
jgi:hypothetical protein